METEYLSHVDPLLRLPQVLQLIPLKKSAVYAEMARGNFPRPVRIGQKAVAWRTSSISAYINSREQVAA